MLMVLANEERQDDAEQQPRWGSGGAGCRRALAGGPTPLRALIIWTAHISGYVNRGSNQGVAELRAACE